MGDPDAGAIAVSLRDYLTANPTYQAFGVEGHSSQRVREFQSAVGIAVGERGAGILGAPERSAARDLGVLLPERPLRPR